MNGWTTVERSSSAVVTGVERRWAEMTANWVGQGKYAKPRITSPESLEKGGASGESQKRLQRKHAHAPSVPSHAWHFGLFASVHWLRIVR